MKTMLLLVSILVTGTIGIRFGATTEPGRPPDPRGRIFVTQGCTGCHAITALGLKASADVGPDLSFAYGDVRTRYAMNLEAFLADPPGAMEVVLASRHRISPVDRDSIVQILRRLYEERKASRCLETLTTQSSAGSLRGSVTPCRRLMWDSLSPSD